MNTYLNHSSSSSWTDSEGRRWLGLRDPSLRYLPPGPQEHRRPEGGRRIHTRVLPPSSRPWGVCGMDEVLLQDLRHRRIVGHSRAHAGYVTVFLLSLFFSFFFLVFLYFFFSCGLVCLFSPPLPLSRCFPAFFLFKQSFLSSFFSSFLPLVFLFSFFVAWFSFSSFSFSLFSFSLFK